MTPSDGDLEEPDACHVVLLRGDDDSLAIQICEGPIPGPEGEAKDVQVLAGIHIDQPLTWSSGDTQDVDLMLDQGGALCLLGVGGLNKRYRVLEDRYDYAVRFTHELPQELRDWGYDEAGDALQDFLTDCALEHARREAAQP